MLLCSTYAKTAPPVYRLYGTRRNASRRLLDACARTPCANSHHLVAQEAPRGLCSNPRTARAYLRILIYQLVSGRGDYSWLRRNMAWHAHSLRPCRRQLPIVASSDYAWCHVLRSDLHISYLPQRPTIYLAHVARDMEDATNPCAYLYRMLCRATINNASIVRSCRLVHLCYGTPLL